MPADNHLIKKVADLYDCLDLEIRNSQPLAGRCKACGQCCDFGKSDHRLFVTTPALIYLAANLAVENLKPMPTSRCPYNHAGKCTVYKHRFAACRIFCCSADPDFQSRLSESALKKLKSLCAEFQIHYRYVDLPTALNNPLAACST